MGTLDTDAEQDFVRRLDETLGFTAEETTKLLDESNRYGNARTLNAVRS